MKFDKRLLTICREYTAISDKIQPMADDIRQALYKHYMSQPREKRREWAAAAGFDFTNVAAQLSGKKNLSVDAAARAVINLEKNFPKS